MNKFESVREAWKDFEVRLRTKLLKDSKKIIDDTSNKVERIEADEKILKKHEVDE